MSGWPRRLAWRGGGAMVLPILGVCFLAGCGYALVGTANPWPELTSIAVMPFENLTTRPEIEQRVTEEVASRLSRRGKFDVVTSRETADAVLEGAVSSYRTTPVEFSAEGRAVRVEVIVTIQASLRKVATDEVLWSQRGLIFKEQYDLPPEGEEFFDQETVAQTEIARGAAGALVTSIFEGF
jgi:TolB-like protein